MNYCSKIKTMINQQDEVNNYGGARMYRTGKGIHILDTNNQTK